MITENLSLNYLKYMLNTNKLSRCFDHIDTHQVRSQYQLNGPDRTIKVPVIGWQSRFIYPGVTS